MDLRQLKYFIAIVDSGTFTQAARYLHVVQPALSQRLAALEEELGVQLVVRGRSGLGPTAAGKTLYAQAQLILKQAEVAQQAVRETAGTLGARVRIGMLRHLAPHLSAALFRSVRETLPDVQPDIFVGYAEELMAKIRTAQLDVSLGVGAERRRHSMGARSIPRRSGWSVCPGTLQRSEHVSRSVICKACLWWHRPWMGPCTACWRSPHSLRVWH